MKKIVFTVCAIIALLACNQQKHSVVPQGFEWVNCSKDDEICTYIKYKQPVNNYTVSAICWTDTLYGEYNSHGVIHFQNDEQEFIVENPLFPAYNLFQEKQSLKNGTLVETDYIPFKATKDTLNNTFFDSSESPFFFFDIDFDGEKELIVTLFGGMGHHGHNAYKAYKIPTINDRTILSAMQGEPFNNLNDYTEIDTIQKTITTPYDIGIRFGGMKKYGLVTHTFFNEVTHSLEERKLIELTDIEHYDWKHTENMKYEICEPTVYHYKKVNGDMKLINIEKCPNDK